MKRPFLPVFLVVCFSFFQSFSQVGIGTASPNQKAVLELKSPGNDQGFLVPRLTTLQRTGMTGLATGEKGLLVFDSDVNKFFYWSGSAWVVIDNGTDSQVLSFDPATGLLTISGGNNVTVTGTTPGGSAGGDLTGTYPNPAITNNAITSAKILDGTVTNADINASAGIAVTKFAPGTNGQVLTTVGGVPAWSTPGVGGTVTNVTTGTGLTGGPITTSGTISIAPNGVTATELRSDATVDANRSVNTDHLRDNSVTSPKIANGAILGIDLADAIISTAKLVDGAVNSLKLGDAAVTTLKLADNAVTSLKLGDAAVTTLKLSDNAVTSLKLGDNAVTTTKILDGAVSTGDLADNAVTNVKVAADAITSAKILDATLVNADIANNAITSAKILDGTLATADLADNAVTTVKVAADAITSAKIFDGTLVTADVSDNAITSAKILDGTIATGDILDGTIGTLDMANSAVTNAKIADNAINSVKIADGTIATADLLDGAITNAKVATGIDVSKLAPGTNGFVLTSVLGNVTWAALPVLGLGTVTSVATAGGLTGGTITTTGTISIADGGVSTIKLADNAITNAKISGDAITSAKVLDGTLATADLADNAITSAKILDATISNADVSATAAVAVSKLAAGTNGNVLTTVLGVPTWQTPIDNSATNEIQSLSIAGTTLSISGGNSVTLPGGGGVSGSGASGQVAFWSGSSSISGNSNLLWDEKDNRLGIGLTPLTNLHVGGSQAVTFSVTATSDYDVDIKDYVIFVPTVTNNVFLPDASAVPGRILIIRSADQDKGVTIRAKNGKDLIDGLASMQLFDRTDEFYTVTLISNGSNWFSISKSRK